VQYTQPELRRQEPKVIVPAFSALQDSSTPVKIGLYSVLRTALLRVALMRRLRQASGGVQAIPLGAVVLVEVAYDHGVTVLWQRQAAEFPRGVIRRRVKRMR
jgi:peptidoglycan biosynthesis protein MviN/MurJ (putative lipid II flippase)